MYVLVVIWGISICMLSGYIGGYKEDCQYREPPGCSSRITISEKWRWLFYFQWRAGPEVLFTAFLSELSSLIAAILILLFGIIFSVIQVTNRAWVPFIIVMAYAWFNAGQSIVFGIKFHRNKRKLHPELHRWKHSWRCAFRQGLQTMPLFCQVTVQNKLDTGESLYQVQYGKIIKREFVGDAGKRYIPECGKTCWAIYNTDPHRPPFSLVPEKVSDEYLKGF